MAELLETSEPVNVGSGLETRISDLACSIAQIVGYTGETIWDTSKPDGQPVRVLDVSRARDLVGFKAEVDLDEGLRRTVAEFETVYEQSAKTQAG